LLSALLLGLFLAIHIGNHIVGLGGQANHLAYMAAVSPLYRNIFIEPLLLALFCWQGVSGLTMIVRGWKDRTALVPWMQALSGAYLAVFLFIHVSAVLTGRAILKLDTDFRFAAAGFQVPHWSWFFAPYYFAAVVALFVHLGCAAFWNLVPQGPRIATAALAGFAVVGVLLGALIVSSLAGWIYPVDIPARYLATYLSP